MRAAAGAMLVVDSVACSSSSSSSVARPGPLLPRGSELCEPCSTSGASALRGASWRGLRQHVGGARRRASHVKTSASLFFDRPIFNPSKLDVKFLPCSRGWHTGGDGGAVGDVAAPTAPPHSAGAPLQLTRRRYTLTHNDVTGSLQLSVGANFNHAQLSGWYLRLLRDEVLAEWEWGTSGSFGGGGASSGSNSDGVGSSGGSGGSSGGSSSAFTALSGGGGGGGGIDGDAALVAAADGGAPPTLHVHVHVSGEEFWIASPHLRRFIFEKEMPLVLQTIRYGDKRLLAAVPELRHARVLVHYHSHVPALNTVQDYGLLLNESSWPTGNALPLWRLALGLLLDLPPPTATAAPGPSPAAGVPSAAQQQQLRQRQHPLPASARRPPEPALVRAAAAVAAASAPLPPIPQQQPQQQQQPSQQQQQPPSPRTGAAAAAAALAELPVLAPSAEQRTPATVTASVSASAQPRGELRR